VTGEAAGARGGGGRRLPPGAQAEVRPETGFGGAAGQGSPPVGQSKGRGGMALAGDRRAGPKVS